LFFGPTAQPNFEAVIAEDNQEFKVGEYTIKALHTLVRSMESITYLL